MSAKKKATNKSTTKRSTSRLRPGELEGLVLEYMRSHKEQLPLTPGAIGRAIGHSRGAVENCLSRLAKEGEARLAKKKPRAYDLTENDTGGER